MILTLPLYILPLWYTHISPQKEWVNLVDLKVCSLPLGVPAHWIGKKKTQPRQSHKTARRLLLVLKNRYLGGGGYCNLFNKDNLSSCQIPPTPTKKAIFGIICESAMGPDTRKSWELQLTHPCPMRHEPSQPYVSLKHNNPALCSFRNTITDTAIICASIVHKTELSVPCRKSS